LTASNERVRSRFVAHQMVSAPLAFGDRSFYRSKPVAITVWRRASCQSRGGEALDAAGPARTPRPSRQFDWPELPAISIARDQAVWCSGRPERRALGCRNRRQGAPALHEGRGDSFIAIGACRILDDHRSSPNRDTSASADFDDHRRRLPLPGVKASGAGELIFARPIERRGEIKPRRQGRNRAPCTGATAARQQRLPGRKGLWADPETFATNKRRASDQAACSLLRSSASRIQRHPGAEYMSYLLTKMVRRSEAATRSHSSVLARAEGSLICLLERCLQEVDTP